MVKLATIINSFKKIVQTSKTWKGINKFIGKDPSSTKIDLSVTI